MGTIRSIGNNEINDNIIDVEGKFVDENITDETKDEIKNFSPPIKVVEVEEDLEEDLEEVKNKGWTNLITINGGAIVIIVAIIIGELIKDDAAKWIKDLFNKEPKTITEDGLTEEQDYDKALADNGATIDEEAPVGAYDEVVGDYVLAFTDANDDEQVQARAHAINIYLQKSNVNDITDEELCDYIKFINGTYNDKTDDEAFDKSNDCLETFGAYSTATEQSANFAGGVVSDNGVIVALGLDAFLTDNCDHRELMDEVSVAFQNVLTANTTGEKVEASKKLLKLEADLMLGLKETPNGTKIYFHSLTSSEAFITGIMFQIANPIIHSALGENIVVTFTDNVGQEVYVKYETLNEYYNPQCNGEYNTENAWAIVNTDLIETAIGKGHSYTPTW